MQSVSADVLRSVRGRCTDPYFGDIDIVGSKCRCVAARRWLIHLSVASITQSVSADLVRFNVRMLDVSPPRHYGNGLDSIPLSHAGHERT